MDYKASFGSLIVHPDKIDDLERIVAKIKANEARYKVVQDKTTVPWYIIAPIHYREANLGFGFHLHNGDPLTERTAHVPKGRPLKGEPPFTWEESAIDALKMSRLTKVKDWSIGSALALLERYNGMGYKNRGFPSPYIWSWTDKYQAGKYVADGHFDPNVVDQQCGVAPIIKLLL